MSAATRNLLVLVPLFLGIGCVSEPPSDSTSRDSASDTDLDSRDPLEQPPAREKTPPSEAPTEDDPGGADPELPFEPLPADGFVAYAQHELEFGDDVLQMVEPSLALLALLGAEPRDASSVLRSFAAQQNPDGTFPGLRDGRSHYAIMSSVYWMAFRRLDVEPPHSLDGWLRTVDTWQEVEAELRAHERPGNFWGGLIGYVALWTLATDEAPPWMADVDALARADFADWTTSPHQLPRAIQALAAAGSEVPHLERVLAGLLESQESDGGWTDGRRDGSVLDATAQNVILLHTWFEGPQVREAIERGVGYLLARQVAMGDRDGFAFGPSERPDPDATLFAVAALVHVGLVEGDPDFLHPLGRF